MKCLIIQVQPERHTLCDVECIIRLCKGAGRYPEVDKEEGSSALYLNFFTEDLSLLWSELRKALFEDDANSAWIKASTVIVCDGEELGSELLLHHFDANEALDSL
ncbi:hypothetical protein [Agaribacterium sp. ZY112]|uniref:hypothetical protein n=1 Tax=Agaribacterium sp. ZY112 TaxID=3233574 RepID=UPI0035244C8C